MGTTPGIEGGTRTRALPEHHHRFTLFNDHNLSNLSFLNLYFNDSNFSRPPLTRGAGPINYA